MTKFTDIGVETHGHVGLIEIRRPPLNFFDVLLINQIADALEEFDRNIEIRASVLAAQGKAFCAAPCPPASASPAPRPALRRILQNSDSTRASASPRRCPT